ncbi:hypothetical protein O181_006483 [Austropuccinia psidii MF-1]|uniref:Uncharacterized protein n=1 Tax=Austropuccinia psidii MF-1 TaxID=1389203 RepID=A0A9Q3BKK4_9BASI|nr:hypothetical protein [Austropuccinia psidii MF-1]
MQKSTWCIWSKVTAERFYYANNVPKAKKKVYAIQKVPEEGSPTEDSDSEAMGDSIREPSDDDQDPREEFLVEYQEEILREIKDIQLESGCHRTLPTKPCANIHKMHKHSWLHQPKGWHIYMKQPQSGEHCSIVARNYLDNHFPNWEKHLLLTKAKNFKSASGKMTSIGTLIKEIIIPHSKGNIRLNPEFVVLDDAYIQGLLLGTYYQRMYVIDIHNSKNRHITLSINKEKKFSLDIYQFSTHDPLEELLNEFREGQLSTTLTSKQKLSLLKILRKDRPAFSIGEEPLGKIKGHHIELYLDVERPYPPMLRRPPYSASLEPGKEIEKHINELLDMYVIRKIGHNEIVEITTPVLITWQDGKSRLC